MKKHDAMELSQQDFTHSIVVGIALHAPKHSASGLQFLHTPDPLRLRVRTVNQDPTCLDVSKRLK